MSTLDQSILNIIGNKKYTIRKKGVTTNDFFYLFILIIGIILFFLLMVWALTHVFNMNGFNRDGFEVKPIMDHIPSVHNNDMKKLHDTCSGLSNSSCKHASFCTLLNGKQCVGGNRHGPTYSTDNGKKVDVKYYHHKNTCYGKCN